MVFSHMNGKSDKWYMYNSTYRNGLTFGNAQDIATVVKKARHNNYQIALGVGMPDLKGTFSKNYSEKGAELEKNYHQIRKCMASRYPDSDLFTRMFLVEKLLRGEVPDNAEFKNFMKQLNIKAVNPAKTQVYPKHPHQAEPHRYDHWVGQDPDRRLQGQLEPMKHLIEREYIPGREITHGDEGPPQDGRTADRIASKFASGRNIDIEILDESLYTPDVQEMRRKQIYTPEERLDVMQGLLDTEFELIALPYKFLDDDQKTLIENGIGKALAESDERPVIIAVPYRRLPVNRDCGQAMAHWFRMERTIDDGWVFHRLLEAKNFVLQYFGTELENITYDTTYNSQLNRCYYTIFEMDKDTGELPDPENSISFLPPNYRASGAWADELNDKMNASLYRERMKLVVE